MNVLTSTDEVIAVLRAGGRIEAQLQLPYPPILRLIDATDTQIDAWIKPLDEATTHADIHRQDHIREGRMVYTLPPEPHA